MKTVHLDDIDKNLLNALQKDFPLTREPFASIAGKLNLPEEEVLQRIQRFKDESVIRTIGPIFDLRRLGYHSTLVAMHIPERRLEKEALYINQHPGVSHNYQRNHYYNLWFTLSLPGNIDSSEVLLRLKKKVKPTAMLELPTVRIIKIKAIFDLQDDSSFENETIDKSMQVSTPNAEEWALISEMQRDTPLVHRPFDTIANRLCITVDTLLQHYRHFEDRGIMRRFGASIKHINTGFAANAMVVWRVPQEGVEEFGRKIRPIKAISHCYERKTNSHWPYNMFTMIHGKTRWDCRKIIEKIVDDTGITEYECLFTMKEFKKIRMQYHSPDSHQLTSSYYPIFLNITGKRCVVIGGGDVAMRKVTMLLDCGAKVEIISPTLCSELKEMSSDGKVKVIQREYKRGDLQDAFVVIAATDDAEINDEAAQEATQLGILVNIVDAPKLSNFIVPSYVRRGDMTIAISTSGKSPALARKIKTELEKQFSEEYAKLVLLLSEVRFELQQRMISVSSETWQKALNLDTLIELIKTGQRDEAKRRLLQILERQSL